MKLRIIMKRMEGGNNAMKIPLSLTQEIEKGLKRPLDKKERELLVWLQERYDQESSKVESPHLIKD